MACLVADESELQAELTWACAREKSKAKQPLCSKDEDPFFNSLTEQEMKIDSRYRQLVGIGKVGL